MSDNTPVPDELAATRERIKQLKAREEELRALLLANPDIRTGGYWVAEIKEVTRKQVDVAELRDCHPELVEEFTFPVTSKHVVLSAITEDGELIPARQMRTKEKAAQ